MVIGLSSLRRQCKTNVQIVNVSGSTVSPHETAKGAFVSESALHSLMAISRILSVTEATAMIIHLDSLS
jgi:hypothetical protein